MFEILIGHWKIQLFIIFHCLDCCHTNWHYMRTQSMSKAFLGTLSLVALVGVGIASYEFYMQDQKMKAESEINHWNNRRDRVKWRDESDYVDMTVSISKQTLQICPNIRQRKRFAITSMLTHAQNKEDIRFYETGAAKLASSIHLWSPQVLSLADLLLLIALDNSTHSLSPFDESLLQNAGWSLCYTTIIDSNRLDPTNRYLQAHMFSRLRMWQLVEYDAVLSIDVDTIVISDISILFIRHFTRMQTRNLTLGAVGDGRLFPCTHVYPPTNFNAGVLLLQPNMTTFTHLVNTVNSTVYSKQYAEQSLLNHVYPAHQYYQLPYTFNTNTRNIHCNQRVRNASILHYTYPKPWSLRRGLFSCAPYDLNCWKAQTGFMNMPVGTYLEGTTHMSLAWEMIPLAVPAKRRANRGVW